MRVLLTAVMVSVVAASASNAVAATRTPAEVRYETRSGSSQWYDMEVVFVRHGAKSGHPNLRLRAAELPQPQPADNPLQRNVEAPRAAQATKADLSAVVVTVVGKRHTIRVAVAHDQRKPRRGSRVDGCVGIRAQPSRTTESGSEATLGRSALGVRGFEPPTGSKMGP